MVTSQLPFIYRFDTILCALCVLPTDAYGISRDPLDCGKSFPTNPEGMPLGITQIARMKEIKIWHSEGSGHES